MGRSRAGRDWHEGGFGRGRTRAWYPCQGRLARASAKVEEMEVEERIGVLLEHVLRRGAASFDTQDVRANFRALPGQGNRRLKDCEIERFNGSKIEKFKRLKDWKIQRLEDSKDWKLKDWKIERFKGSKIACKVARMMCHMYI
jgi:hypothetical protein